MARSTKFAKSGAASVIFDRAELIPQGNDYTIEQNVGRSYGNSKKIDSYNDTAVRFITLSFTFITLTLRDEIITFFNDSNVNWRKNNFTYTDPDGNDTTVRLAQDSLSIPRTSPGGKYSMEILLEVE